jgi:hypothetical protein
LAQELFDGWRPDLEHRLRAEGDHPVLLSQLTYPCSVRTACGLNSWRDIGAVERGMAHQGYDLQLTRYDERGWRATFYTTGMEHSPTSSGRRGRR